MAACDSQGFAYAGVQVRVDTWALGHQIGLSGGGGGGLNRVSKCHDIGRESRVIFGPSFFKGCMSILPSKSKNIAKTH